MADTYYASVRESVAGANKRHLGVFNAAGSGKVMVVYRIVAIGSPTAAVTGLVIPLAAIRLTSAPSDGTPTTLAKAWPADITGGRAATPNPPAQVTAFMAHTTGTVEAVGFGGGVVSGEETASANESVVYEAPIDGSEQIACPEGWGFEVRQLTLASAGNVGIVAVIGLLTPAETL
jgi:hypothetical protein